MQGVTRIAVSATEPPQNQSHGCKVIAAGSATELPQNQTSLPNGECKVRNWPSDVKSKPPGQLIKQRCGMEGLPFPAARQGGTRCQRCTGDGLSPGVVIYKEWLRAITVASNSNIVPTHRRNAFVIQHRVQSVDFTLQSQCLIQSHGTRLAQYT